jgi:hypothetical protein
MGGSAKPNEHRKARKVDVSPCVVEMFKIWWEACTTEDRRTLYDIMKRKIEGVKK